ncbi:hypothetical protein D3C79_1024640 [compost metagenome]
MLLLGVELLQQFLLMMATFDGYLMQRHLCQEVNLIIDNLIPPTQHHGRIDLILYQALVRAIRSVRYFLQRSPLKSFLPQSDLLGKYDYPLL